MWQGMNSSQKNSVLTNPEKVAGFAPVAAAALVAYLIVIKAAVCEGDLDDGEGGDYKDEGDTKDEIRSALDF